MLLQCELEKAFCFFLCVCVVRQSLLSYGRSVYWCVYIIIDFNILCLENVKIPNPPKLARTEWV